ncbi:porin family protein [Flavobacteriaceae bacterium GSB9]|nr:porin family protein [Flavobacteriaceae bacterium GSB9]
MLKKLFYLSICLLTYFAHAQLSDSYEKGFVVKTNNDTLHGYIKTDDLKGLSTHVCFTINQQKEECTIYSTSDVKSFRTETGKIFDLLKVKINNNQIEISVFANLILEGKTALYKSVYKSSNFYIISKTNENFALQEDKLQTGDSKITRYNYYGILNLVTENMLTETNTKVSFKESDFIETVTKFNTLKGYESRDVRYKEKTIKYFIAMAGVGTGKYEQEFYYQAMYRIYNPKISRSISVNLGVNYFNYEYSKEGFSIEQSLISVPLQFQQNLLSKNIRPYLFVGPNFSYLNRDSSDNRLNLDKGFQKNFGVDFLYGIGLEIDLYKGLMLKSEYRHETFSHPILFGIGYNFSK